MQSMGPQIDELARPFQAQAALLAEAGVDAPLIFDVGANRGQTVDAYLVALPDATFHCFEPDAENVASLSRRLEGLSTVQIVATAIGDSSGTALLHLSSNHTTHSLLSRPPQSERRYFKSFDAPSGETVAVPVTTIDAYVERNAITLIDILKMDVQGSEIAAIRGAEKTLSSGAVRLIYVEAYCVPFYEGAALLPQIWAALDVHGYSLFDIFEESRASNGQLRRVNALFVSPATRQGIIDARPEED